MSAETVHTIIDDLGALLLFTMILIVAASQISRAIYAVAAQSFLIAIAVKKIPFSDAKRPTIWVSAVFRVAMTRTPVRVRAMPTGRALPAIA